MKTTLTITVSIIFFILLIFALVLSNFNQTTVSAQGASAVTFPLQTTPVAQADDTSVIGSTNGILLMGIVIVAIVTLPLLFRKKRK